MLASLIFRKEPFFHGHDNYDQVNLRPKLFFNLVKAKFSQHLNLNSLYESPKYSGLMNYSNILKSIISN